MNIYVGNLAEQTTEEELREAFAAYGQVLRIRIPADKLSGLPRGFGLIEMDEGEGVLAIAGLNGSELRDRVLNVHEARPRPERGARHVTS